MKPDIKIGKRGKVLTGENIGWHIFIQDDSANTGGYLILRSPDEADSKTGEGFDDWVENIDQLEQFFKFADWKIEWLE